MEYILNPKLLKEGFPKTPNADEEEILFYFYDPEEGMYRKYSRIRNLIFIYIWDGYSESYNKEKVYIEV